MCAIAGLVRREGWVGLEDRELVARMMQAMAHRGPDGDGLWHDTRVCFGHRRLAILDLTDAGRQPMTWEGLPVVTYNGEIYNYVELRDELSQHGVTFRTKTDTEVLVAGYVRWGIRGLLERLEGMFAFALYDGRRTYLARDRFGIKPLYYRMGADAIRFASDVRVLQGGEAYSGALNLFLQWGSLVHAHTTAAFVLALPPASYAQIDEHELRVYPYWSLESAMRAEPRPFALRSLLEDIIAKHTRADVPVSVFLSGGVDSSVLSLLASNARGAVTLPVCDEEWNAVVHVVHGKQSDARPPRPLRKTYAPFLSAMDQPTIDGLNVFEVSRVARTCGYKVALSGLGADEVFSGYRHHGMLGVLFGYRRFRKLFWPKNVARLLDATEKDCQHDLYVPPKLTDTQAITYLEFTHYLHDQLLRDTDWASMAHGVEVRVPYLDHRLVEAVLPLPKKRSLTRPKPLLLDAVPELPRTVWDRPKRGFTLPMDRWLRDDVDFWEDLATSTGPLHPPAVRAVWHRFRQGQMHWSRAWATVIASQWPRWTSAF